MNHEIRTVDFHAHILPCLDHGSDSLETSLFQLRLAKTYGFSRLIATPHFYPNSHSVDSFLERRDEAYEKLLNASVDKSLYADIRLGCELLMCEGISKLPHLDRFAIRGTKILLLELPFSDFSNAYVNEVRILCELGYELVLAHAERYEINSIEAMKNAGAKLQLNATALCGLFVPRAIRSWLQSSDVVALGSDIHMRDKNSYKRLFKAMRYIHRFPYVITESDRIWNESVI